MYGYPVVWPSPFVFISMNLLRLTVSFTTLYRRYAVVRILDGLQNSRIKVLNERKQEIEIASRSIWDKQISDIFQIKSKHCGTQNVSVLLK